MNTTERRESSGIVVDALRRPIEDAVREGVREAMREQDVEIRRPEEESGGGGKYALLALVGLGVAALLLWRKRSGGSGGPSESTESIRARSKTDHPGPSGAGRAGPTSSETEGSTGSESGGGAFESSGESDEAEDAAPEASGE